jgi:hypothetical protein
MITVGAVTTLKAPLEEVIRFVNYHLNSGVDHLYLYFDDPDDSAISLVERRSRVTCIRCDEDYWADVPKHRRDSVIRRQGVNGTRALQLARERGLDWLFHIDVDELIYSPMTIQHELASTPDQFDIFTLRTLEAVPEQLEAGLPFLASRYFRALPLQLRVRRIVFCMSKWLGCGKYFLENRYFRGHQVGKSAVRTSADPYRINPHRPLFHGEKRSSFFNHQARVLHYESNHFEAWMIKMQQWLPQDWEKNPRSKTLTPQLEKIAEILKQDESDTEDRLKALYTTFYFIRLPGRWVLRSLGLLRKIMLDPKLFECSGDLK